MAPSVLHTDGSAKGLADAHESAVGDGDLEAPGQAHQPLKGVVLCCTAISPEARSALAEVAGTMGAKHALDLTAAVTHLLVGSWETDKYAFVARARPDVRVLVPEFVDAVRTQWLSGTDHVDVKALEKTHCLPALREARVCVTGFSDAEERKGIERRVRAAGGHYSGDLTRDVTHLIAAKPEGAKYAAARQWKIRVVVLQWLNESLERGMLLDASKFDPSLATAEIGRGAWVRPSAHRVEETRSAVKRKGDEPSMLPARKLRRTASAKFSSQNGSIWGDIVTGPTTKEEKRDSWADDRAPSMPLHDNQIPSELRRTVSAGSLTSKGEPKVTANLMQKGKDGLFSSFIVHIHGFGDRETMVLERHLNTHAAALFNDATAFANTLKDRIHSAEDKVATVTFIILVPHTFYPLALPTPLSSLENVTIATEFYIEACLHAHSCLSPSSSPLYAPLPANIPGFMTQTICATGFADIELLHLSKAVKRFGAEYSGTLRKDTSVLICRPTNDLQDGKRIEKARIEKELENRDKVRFSRAHGIPVIWVDWLWVCVKAGRRLSSEGWEVGERTNRDPTKLVCKADSDNKGKEDLAFRSSMQNSAPTKPKGHGAGAALPLSAIDTNITTKGKQQEGQRTGLAHQNVNDKAPIESKETALTTALNTLLAARSRSNSMRRGSASYSADQSATTSFGGAHTAEVLVNGPSLRGAMNDDQGGGRRRRRTLLGRAPSSASLRSVASVGSVGSVNTDGVGTPLSESAPYALFGRELDNPGDGQPGQKTGEDDEPVEPGGKRGPEPPLTQVAYQDVPAQEWRRQMEARMAGAGSDGRPALGEDEAAPDEANRTSVSERARRRSRRIRDEGMPEDLSEDNHKAGGRRILRPRA